MDCHIDPPVPIIFLQNVGLHYCVDTSMCPARTTQVFIWKSFHFPWKWPPKAQSLSWHIRPRTSFYRRREAAHGLIRAHNQHAGPWLAPGESEDTFRLSALRSCGRGSTKPSTLLCCKFERLLRSKLGFNKKKHGKRQPLWTLRGAGLTQSAAFHLPSRMFLGESWYSCSFWLF